ncbi:RidA family protein [Streptosporangium subroseum]|uniref:RidA family protein n=1 Tax=Streptosporangium subroseum TaxID=106412 RepID=UPI003090D0EF|nr:RidA family protein [Streptosporangium subroseum]
MALARTSSIPATAGPARPTSRSSTWSASALANLDAVLAEHGLSRDDVVKCQVFLASISDWSALNAIYEEYFSRPYPARSAFGVQLHPGALVEIEAVASYPPSSGAS